MSDVLLTLLGAAVVVAVFADALATTLVVGGAGPLTRFVLRAAWRLVLRLHRRDTDSRLLVAAGPALLFSTVLVWVLGLWAGWSLVLLGADTVVDATTSVPAALVDVVYYAGFTVFTLGVGDYVAATEAGRILTAVASFSGLFLITLAITYLLSVIGAVVARRALAIHIHTLGDDACNIVARGWTGQDFSSAFVQQLVNLTGQLTTSAEQHLAYPVLHYFRSRDRTAAAPVAIAHLDEAVFLLSAGIAASARPHPSTVEPVRQAIERYLTTAAMTGTVDEDPGTPSATGRGRLQEAGIELAPEEEYRQAVTATAGRRRRLQQLLTSNGWSWPGA